MKARFPLFICHFVSRVGYLIFLRPLTVLVESFLPTSAKRCVVTVYPAMARSLTSISKQNGYDASSYCYVPVAILGAGESGIAMGCRLKEELGFDQFRLFDRQADIGGTWWINRYPGIACDML